VYQETVQLRTNSCTRRNRRAGLIAEEIRSAVEALRFHFRGTPVRVAVSCGLTELPEQDGAGQCFRPRRFGALQRQAQRQEFMRCGRKKPRGSARDLAS